MTHHATNLDLPGEANITTAAGDVATFQSTGSNTVQCISYTKADGTGVVSSGGITLGTSQSTASGSAIDFTGIPAGTKIITMSLTGVSIDGAEGIFVQLGDAGGIETTGYLSAAFNDVGHNNSVSGFLLNNSTDAGSLWHGTYILTLVDSAAFSWVGSWSMASTTTIDGSGGGGSKSLSAELTQVRLTSETPSDFDAGKVNITYQ
jgi:hypothetical protein